MPQNKMLLDVKPHHIRKLVGDYRRSTDSDSKTCYEFLLNNARTICKNCSFNTFKEFTLNYRILFDRKKHRKVINDYKTYVMAKKVKHTSNIAISYNMITAVKVDQELEIQILEFMYDQLDKPELNKFRNSPHFLKKHMMMEYVKHNIITKTPK